MFSTQRTKAPPFAMPLPYAAPAWHGKSQNDCKKTEAARAIRLGNVEGGGPGGGGKIRYPLSVPIIRTMVFGGPYWVPLLY